MGNYYSIDHIAEDHIHTDNVVFIFFLHIFCFKLQKGSTMGNYYSIDHIAKDHIHTDITCNIEEPHQGFRLEPSVTGSKPMNYCLMHTVE